GQKEPARLAFEAALGYRGEGRSGPELEARSLLVWLEGKSAGLGGLAYGKGDERWAGFPWRPKPEEGEMDVRRRGSPTAGAWRTLLAELSKSSPDCWPVRYSLARLLAGEGKTTEAVALLQEVVKSRPDWWAPYYALADHQSREGLHDAAQASLQRVLALAPECQAARAALSLLKSRPKK
ncbi:MAG: tetratricopeptide repeat protein, partial [Armatimonadetes bacterium]|nr:tetratricopeptide repeat protein [Armatimonadota bacterium]